jgi:hypothetical protein
MSAKTAPATILIRENTLLPAGMMLETEAFLPGWRAVQNLNGHGVAHRLESAKWNFFFLAGVIATTVLGREGPGSLRKAVKRILAKREGQNFNSLQITKVVSRRLLGVPYISVSAHSRHIQEGMYLIPVRDFRTRNAAAVMPPPVRTIVLGSDGESHSEESPTEHDVAIV